jgi:hypothetical protein
VEFLLLIWASPTSQVEDVQEYLDLDDLLTASGELVSSAPFRGPDDTAAVRVRDGEVVVSAGPAQRSDEWLAGYYLVDCASPERAREIAALVPDARTGTVEVKPVLPM